MKSMKYDIRRLLKVGLHHPRPLCNLLEEYNRDYIIERYGLEYGLPTIDFLDIFPKFDEIIDPFSFLEGGSLITDLVLLKLLARRYDPCRYLEIGTWRGESVANVASIADECYTVSFSEEEMRKENFPNRSILVHSYFSKDLNNVTHIGHDSRTFDFTTINKKFDLLFLDGDHSYESVKIDTRNAFQLLRDSRSMIVWHDYGVSPETVRWSVLAGIMDGCPKEKLKNLYHVSNTMCAIYTNERFETTITEYPQIPNKKFTVRLSAIRL